MGNVLPFPCAAMVRHDVAKPVRTRRKTVAKAAAEPLLSREREEQLDRMAEVVAERAKRRIAEWQAQQGMASEESALVARLAVLAGSRGDGLNTMTLYQLDALLMFAGWRNGDV